MRIESALAGASGSRAMPERRVSNDNLMARAIYDVRAALSAWRLWGLLGSLDIRQKYRRSYIGPLWITLSMGVMVVALGLIYGTLFGVETRDFLPYLACGFIAWALISTMIVEGATVFIGADSLIKHGNIPLLLHPLRMFWRNTLVFVHNCAILIGVYLWFGLSLSVYLVLLPLTYVLVSVTLVSVATIVGILSARYRDLPPVVSSVVQIAFFVTPIIFSPDMLSGARAFIWQLNPLYYLVEGLRAPLLGEPVGARLLAVLASLAVVSSAVAFALFVRTRGRVPYWL